MTIDKDEAKVILELYKAGKINLNQALNNLGYDGAKMHEKPIEPVEWPAKVVKPIKEFFDGSC
jgi:hypothetical protein